MKSSLQKTAQFFGIAAAVVIVSSCSIRQVQDETRTVSTSGTGSVYVTPDQAVLTLSVITSSADVTAAVADNAERTTNVIKALEAADIGKDNISTENYGIYQESGWNNGRHISGDYRVSNEIAATIHRIDQCGAVIDTAIKAGANDLSSIDFTVSTQENAEKQARILAVKQAEANAKLLADTSGARIGKILTLSEVNRTSGLRSVNLEAKNTVAAGAYTTPVSAGKTKISVTVLVTYILQ